MKALKIAVAALVVLVAGLLFTIHRLRTQVTEQPPAEVAQAAEPAPTAQLTTPPPVVAPPAETKPSPLPPRRAAPRAARPAPSAPAAPPAPPDPVAEKPAAAAPASSVVPSEAPTPPKPPAPPAPRTATLAAGAAVVVRTQNTLSTERNFTGDTFVATLAEPLVVDGFVIAEKGADVEGRIVRSEKGGRVEGVASLSVEMVRLHTADGQKLAIATGLHQVEAQRERGSDAKKVGVATGVGAIIGAIAGGGKGAAIGAGVGAGAGAGTVAATRGQHASIPSESILRFELRTPVTITEQR